MKYKYMTEEQVKTINKLCADGYGETLMAYGMECKEIWETGFCKGFRRALAYKCMKGAVGIAAVVGTLGLVGIAAEAVEKKIDDAKKDTEVTED